MCNLLLILLSIVLFHHLGLADELSAVVPNGKLRKAFLCSKCCTFWCCLGYALAVMRWGIVSSLAVSFTLAYLAMWTELLLSYVATLYEKLYEKINHAEADKESAD